MNNQWNTKIVGIPYRGGGPAAQALAANDVQVTRFGVGNFTGLLEGGKVKALAVGLPKRSPLLPECADAWTKPGCRAFPGQGWWGLAAPRGTPPAIVERLNSEFAKLFSEPKFMAFLDKQAVVVGADHAGGLRRVPEAGPQGGRDADQDREHQARGIQAGEVGAGVIGADLYCLQVRRVLPWPRKFVA